MSIHEVHVLELHGTGDPVRLYFLPDDGGMQRTYSATTGSTCVTADCKQSARSLQRRFYRKLVCVPLGLKEVP